MLIDTSFDVRTDTPPGRDPDACSPTLRRYHQLLWSKPLPCGRMFALTASGRQDYLRHESELGTFSLTSDLVIPSFTRWGFAALNPTLCAKEDNEAFEAIAYTIGSAMVFPGQRVGRKATINGARGMHPRIRDRFDLTVECIRRHYIGQPSPLANAMARYRDFFELFGDFRGFVDFFLLQDLVTSDGTIRFAMPFDDFQAKPDPKDLDTFLEYRRRSIEFIDARNRRIERYAASLA